MLFGFSTSATKWNSATCNFEADGYRLPTEAEWEWLARGGENYTYAGSDSETTVENALVLSLGKNGVWFYKSLRARLGANKAYLAQ